MAEHARPMTHATVVRRPRRDLGGRRADDAAGQGAERQGRRPVADRVCFEAIVFVMIAGIAWGHLPSELGCSGVTASRRLRDWLADTLAGGKRNDVTQLLPLPAHPLGAPPRTAPGLHALGLRVHLPALPQSFVKRALIVAP
jgi:hypothetical protein